MNRLGLYALLLVACNVPPRIPDDTIWLQPPHDEGIYAMVASTEQNAGDLIVLEKNVGVSAGIARISAETGAPIWRHDAHGLALQMNADGETFLLSAAPTGGYQVDEIDGDGATLSTFMFDVIGRFESFSVGGRMAALFTCSDVTMVCHIEVRHIDGGAIVWESSFGPGQTEGSVAVAADGSVVLQGSVYDPTGNVVPRLGVPCDLARYRSDGDLLCAGAGVISRHTVSGDVVWEQATAGVVYGLAEDTAGVVYAAEVVGDVSDGTGVLERFGADGTSVRNDPFYTQLFDVAVGRHVFVWAHDVGLVAFR